MSSAIAEIGKAQELHERGDLAGAVSLYQQILQADPQCAQAWHHMGLAAFQSGDLRQAATWIQKAITLDPTTAFFHANLAAAMHALGDLEASERCFRQALALQENNATWWNNLGGILLQRGQNNEAERCYLRATKIAPESHDAFFNLGVLRSRRRDWFGAAEFLIRALQLSPRDADTQFYLGMALVESHHDKEAEMLLRDTLRAKPDHAVANWYLGRALMKLDRPGEALPFLERAVALKDDLAEAHCSLGLCYLKHHRREQAHRCFETAIALEPKIAFATTGLAVTELLRGNYERAMELCNRAVAIRPDDAIARFQRACLSLMNGDFERGWEEFVWIRRSKELSAAHLNGESWDGKPIPGKTLVLRAEQGFGDIIQFVRYAALAKKRAGRVLVEGPESLAKLLRTTPGVDDVLIGGAPLPEDCASIPLFNLPKIFRTTQQTVPSKLPYFSPQGELPASMREALAASKGFRVGLCWQGRPTHTEDDLRSIPAVALQTLGGIEGASFFSLQKGPGEEGIHALHCLGIAALATHARDFHDTALAIQELDLVIAVDTAVAHLAGAMGKPVWLLLPFVGEWRWMREREDSPWYPTMRIFRQKTHGDWPGVLASVRAALEERVRQAATKHA